jgi:hypothetical protein
MQRLDDFLGQRCIDVYDISLRVAIPKFECVVPVLILARASHHWWCARNISK